jgi:hypothetical protein
MATIRDNQLKVGYDYKDRRAKVRKIGRLL